MCCTICHAVEVMSCADLSQNFTAWNRLFKRAVLASSSSRADLNQTLSSQAIVNPDRLGATSRLDAPNHHGTSSIMTFILQHSIRCSWCYSFSAGCGEHLLTQKELEEKQKSFKRPVPHHFIDALKRHRANVLQMGYADSWTDSVESDL